MSDFPQADDSLGLMTQFFVEDVNNHRFRYHLLRLQAMAGLTEQDVEELGELGRLVFQNSQTPNRAADQAAKIAGRPDASQLAVTIAGIVQGSARGMGPDAAPNIERVLMGTLIGAYLSTGDIPNHDGPTLASLGAIAGAAAMAVGAFTMDTISRIPPGEYLTTSD